MFSTLIDRIKEYKTLRFLAYHDSLTGLLNRNWFNKHIDIINFRYVYFIDINNLKLINEKGHEKGDEHIKKIVKLFNVFYNEILIRYGGDEFLFFTNRKYALETNEHISVGCAEIKDDIIKAINDADKEMIIFKEHKHGTN